MGRLPATDTCGEQERRRCQPSEAAFAVFNEVLTVTKETVASGN